MDVEANDVGVPDNANSGTVFVEVTALGGVTPVLVAGAVVVAAADVVAAAVVVAAADVVAAAVVVAGAVVAAAVALAVAGGTITVFIGTLVIGCM